MQVFRPGEFCYFNIPILSGNEIINTTEAYFKLLIKPKPNYVLDYEYISFTKDDLKANKASITRFSEFELMKNAWTDISKLSLHLKTTTYIPDQIRDEIPSVIFQKSNEKFLPFFEIKKIFFSEVGFLIFKIVLVACKVGIIPKDKVGLLLIIKHPDELIENEVKNNSLICEYSSQLQLKLGDTLVYYISHTK